MSQLPIDTSVEAEYSDGFILSETEQNDQSAYVPCPEVDGVPTGPNTLNDILEKRPEAEHGKMVRFSVYYKDARYDINWTTLPENARPIRFRDGYNYLDGSGNEVFGGWTAIRFGYQYNDQNGNNHKEIQEIK